MTDRLIIDYGNRKKAGNDQFREPDIGRNDSTGGNTGAGTSSKTASMEPDEVVWGNDRALMKMVDEVQRADLRLFVRIRHIQKVICSMVYEDIAKEPYRLDRPLEMMIVDLSVGGIGVICEHEIETGSILGIPIVLDAITYDVICETVYCIPMDGKYRAGFKIAKKDKDFIKHLKIFVARISLTNTYASGE